MKIYKTSALVNSEHDWLHLTSWMQTEYKIREKGQGRQKKKRTPRSGNASFSFTNWEIFLPFPAILSLLLWGLFYAMNIPNLGIRSLVFPYFWLIMYFLLNKKNQAIKKKTSNKLQPTSTKICLYYLCFCLEKLTFSFLASHLIREKDHPFSSTHNVLSIPSPTLPIIYVFISSGNNFNNILIFVVYPLIYGLSQQNLFVVLCLLFRIYERFKWNQWLPFILAWPAFHCGL